MTTAEKYNQLAEGLAAGGDETTLRQQLGLPSKAGSTGPQAIDLGMDDRDLLLSALQHQGESDPYRDAWLADLSDDAIQETIAVEKNRLTQQAEQQRQAEYDASPQGRAERVRQLKAEQAARERLVADSKLLLTDQGFGDVIESMTDDEIVAEGGLLGPSERQKELAEANDLQANLDAIAATEPQEGGESA